MKRDFLKELGLEESIIDQIMTEHGKTVTKLQNKIGAKDTEINTLQEELRESAEKVKEFEKIDVEKLETEVSEWKSKYENYEKDVAVDAFFKDYKFTSDLAKKATISEFKAQNFELKEGKFDGADEFMEKFIKENESAFVSDNNPDKNTQSNPYTYIPSSGAGTNDDAFTSGLDAIFGKNEN